MEGVRRALTALAAAAVACGPQAVAIPPPAPASIAAPAERAPLPAQERERRGLTPWSAGTPDEREAMYVRLANEVAPASAPTTFTGKLPNWPVNGRISSPFGPRWGGFHNGLDVAAPMNTPVLAAAPGQVAAAGRPYLAYGDTAVMVIVVHDPGFVTLYVHLDETRLPPVKVGDKVRAGDVVGYVGLTGWTTGPHVHFMTVVNGRAVDPLSYLP